MQSYSLTLPRRANVHVLPTSGAYVVRQRQYILRDEPALSPKESIVRRGPDLMAIQDLLQVVVGDIPNLSQKIQEYGAPLLANLRSTAEVQDLLGVDQEQASKILAALAVGKRLFASQHNPLPIVQSIDDVARHCRSMTILPKEQLKVLLINSKYQIFHEETLAIGTIDSLQLTAKEVFQAAAARQASAVILVHNHPSGDPTPSEADISFTQSMVKAGELLGLPLLDHVIITPEQAVSCLQNAQSG